MANRKEKKARIFIYVFIGVVLIVTLFPFYWIINMSLQKSIELYDVPPNLVPPKPTLENFKSILLEERGLMRFHQAVLNTLIVALLTMTVCVIVGSITGYALARLRVQRERHRRCGHGTR